MRAVLLLVLALAQFSQARQALDLGRTRDDALFEAFNRGYELAVQDPIDRVEVVTEFRRAVLLVRDKYNLGEFGMTESGLAKAIQPFEGKIAFVVEVRLNPMHTFAGPPSYELYISTGPATKPIASKAVKRDPIYPPGLGLGSSFIGVRVTATFDRADIEKVSTPMLTVADDNANVIWQARLDLSRYR